RGDSWPAASVRLGSFGFGWAAVCGSSANHFVCCSQTLVNLGLYSFVHRDGWNVIAREPDGQLSPAAQWRFRAVPSFAYTR
ncbi:MAG: hypothetical protein ACREH8_05565, partial [Opitutaceae bacterium]